jgi:hypothetical protein
MSDESGKLLLEIRQGLDRGWHRTYPASRRRLQDEIVLRVCKGTVCRNACSLYRTWVLFTAGPIGVGERKSPP